MAIIYLTHKTRHLTKGKIKMSQTIRAKFHCTAVTKSIGGKYNSEGKYEQGVLYSYNFQAVTSGSDENKSFYASTPSGQIQLQAVRDDLFEIAKEYYLDFTVAEA